MRWVGCGMLAVLLALPVSRGDDKKDDKPPAKDQKDAKEEKKPLSAKEQYQALVKDHGSQQRELVAQINKAKDKERQVLLNKYFGLGKEFADKFYQLAEDNPKDPVATDALFWVVQNAAGSPVHAKATDKVKTLIAEMPLKDLTGRLLMMRGANAAVLEAIIKRSEKDEKDPASGDLVAWVAMNSSNRESRQKAIDRMLEKYLDHKGIEQVVVLLGRSGGASADAALRKILKKDPQPKVKAAATLALARVLAAKTDELGDNPGESDKVASEADNYFTAAIELYKDAPAAKEAEREMNARTKGEAEKEMKTLRVLRCGKEAPEIKGPDLDGKEFKLSDYRGKVVLLDFWGHW